MSYDMTNAYEDAVQIVEGVVATAQHALNSKDPAKHKAALEQIVKEAPPALQEVSDEVDAMG